jgi:hypothetical protein
LAIGCGPAKNKKLIWQLAKREQPSSNQAHARFNFCSGAKMNALLGIVGRWPWLIAHSECTIRHLAVV